MNRNLPIYLRRVSCLFACALLFALTSAAQSAHPDRPLGPVYSVRFAYRINGNTSTRHTVHAVALHRGDVLRLVGRPDGKEPAPVDYIEVTPIANATQVGSRK